MYNIYIKIKFGKGTKLGLNPLKLTKNVRKLNKTNKN